MAQHISEKIKAALNLIECRSLADDVWRILEKQNFSGRLLTSDVEQLCHQHQLTQQQLALHILPIGAAYSYAAISHFHVGAIVIGTSGNFYFGTNLEFAGTNIQQTVHAEQSAISHAWMMGENGLTDVIVNYTPCGHCRQFMNELNSASQLKIHLPHSQNNLLYQYLPDAFGPKNLNISHLLLDKHNNQLSYLTEDKLVESAVQAANMAHAPYSHCCNGIALQTKSGEIFKGSYAENAAFNPSLPALQVALNCLLLNGYDFSVIERVVMVEKSDNFSYRNMAEDLLEHLGDVKLEYIRLP